MRATYLLLAVCVLVLASRASAHGAHYEIVEPKGLTIRASFDGGAPMANAEVLIFAPGQTHVTNRARTDSSGIFRFLPTKPGTWVLQVRAEGGHGMRINLEINKDLRLGEASGPSGVSTLQQTIMALCVVWGFIGTALFFRRRKA